MIAIASKEFDTRKYARLISRCVPKAIESAEEYKRALEDINKFMDKGENLSNEEGALLTLLSILVERYEDEHYPMPKVATPLNFLTHFMEARGVQSKDLWEVFGAKSTTSYVLNGKRKISKAHAKKLAEFFHVSVELFI